MKPLDVLVSNREIDMPQERIVDNFLTTFFYNKCFYSVESVNDYRRQVKGVDIIADGMYIDNKAQSSPRYVNKLTETFILELSFINKYEKETCGWFVNPESLTTHYLFVWLPEATVDEKKRLVDGGIHRAEVMLVDKKKIKEMINTYYSDEQLFSVADRMRTNKVKNEWSKIQGCKFSHSPDYFEKPVNIVATKSFLKQFSTMHCMVTRDAVYDITQ